MPSESNRDVFVLPRRDRIERLGPHALRLLAPAKINLNLLVGPRGPDGFHEIDSLVAKVTLYDEIELRGREEGEIRFTCRGAGCGGDEKNLALRAARLLAEGRHVGGVDITLSKHIPPGRGLGGGSSDAAAVLIGLNELWQLGVSAAELSALAASLGSDVPLFFGPPAARMTGRGELLEEISVHPFVAVLILPDFTCRTSAVYRAFDEAPAAVEKQLEPPTLGGSPSQWRAALVNQLLDLLACLPRRPAGDAAGRDRLPTLVGELIAG